MKGNWEANSYLASTNWQQSLNREFINTHQFLGKENILDIGCGAGEFTHYLTTLVPAGLVVGIDNSKNMIDFAKNTYNHQRLKFIEMDAENLNLSQKFDLIISTFCFHWLVNKAKVFQRMVDHLKEEGQIYLVVPFENKVLTTVKKKIMHQSKWSKFFGGRSDPQDTILDVNYLEYARDAGLNHLDYMIESKNIKYENIQTLSAILKNITAILAFLPNITIKNNFISEFIAEYLKIYPPEKDGSCLVNCTYLKLKARK